MGESWVEGNVLGELRGLIGGLCVAPVTGTCGAPQTAAEAEQYCNQIAQYQCHTDLHKGQNGGGEQHCHSVFLGVVLNNAVSIC